MEDEEYEDLEKYEDKLDEIDLCVEKGKKISEAKQLQLLLLCLCRSAEKIQEGFKAFCNIIVEKEARKKD